MYTFVFSEAPEWYKKAKTRPASADPVSFFSEPYRSLTHTTRRTYRRQECCERGYYHLHRQLYDSLLLHGSMLFLLLEYLFPLLS